MISYDVRAAMLIRMYETALRDNGVKPPIPHRAWFLRQIIGQFKQVAGEAITRREVRIKAEAADGR